MQKNLRLDKTEMLLNITRAGNLQKSRGNQHPADDMSLNKGKGVKKMFSNA